MGQCSSIYCHRKDGERVPERGSGTGDDVIAVGQGSGRRMKVVPTKACNCKVIPE